MERKILVTEDGSRIFIGLELIVKSKRCYYDSKFKGTYYFNDSVGHKKCIFASIFMAGEWHHVFRSRFTDLDQEDKSQEEVKHFISQLCNRLVHAGGDIIHTKDLMKDYYNEQAKELYKESDRLKEEANKLMQDSE